MDAWWSQDRATLERLTEPNVLESFEPTPDGLDSYHINDDGLCFLGTSAAGACTVTLVAPEGGGFTWRLYYRELDSAGNTIIYDVEALGGGA